MRRIAAGTARGLGILCAAALLLVSCGGGGSGTITPPPPSPAATLSPNSVAFGNQTLNTSSDPQSVTLTNSGNAALSITGITITGANAGDFSQTNACGASLAAGSNCNIVVSFTPTAAGARSAAVSIADNASGSPQTVSLTGTGTYPPFAISPTSATYLLGSTNSPTLNGPGTCVSALFGNMPVSVSGTAYTVAYTVPQALPSAWTDTLTCTATNGGAQVTEEITLQYPTPTITSVSPGTLGTDYDFAPSPVFTGNLPINGSGFLPDSVISVNPDPSILASANPFSWNQLTVNYRFLANGAPWDPGFLGFTASDPATGHGGGTSNMGNLAFLGDQNLLAFNATDAFSLDPGTNTIHKFKLSDGSPDGNFTFSVKNSADAGVGLAVDDSTGWLVLFTVESIQAFDPVTNARKFYFDASVPGALGQEGVQGGAAKGGWVVFGQFGYPMQGGPNVLSCINLSDPSTVYAESVYDTPQNFPSYFHLVDLGGTLTAVVYSTLGATLSTVSIPSLKVVGDVALPNIATDNTLQTHAGQGGWQLQVFDSGSSQGTAVVLSQYDQVLVYVDLASMTEIRRVDLKSIFANASPPLPVLQSFRIGKDEVDGSVVVAFADSQHGTTVLYNVDASGEATPLKDTAPFLATGIQESSDGTQIYWGNRSSFAAIPKQ